MNRAHTSGITGVASLLAADTGSSTAIAPARLTLHRSRGAFFLAARDADRQAFNRRFGASLLTEEDARRQLGVVRDRVRNGYRDYAPIDFGGGLSFGRIASTDSGTGRWEFFNGRIVAPLVAGKRVLDLGCNNGSLTLMMLRAGASEVIGIELTPEIAELARLNVRILSWRDAREYRCDVLTGDMRMWLTRDLGRFDVITAFCSLYYLPESEMRRIIRKGADTGAALILQSNDDIEHLPAQADVLRRLLLTNGYPHVRVVAYPGFPRQLLVASVDSRVRFKGPSLRAVDPRASRPVRTTIALAVGPQRVCERPVVSASAQARGRERVRQSRGRRSSEETARRGCRYGGAAWYSLCSLPDSSS